MIIYTKGTILGFSYDFWTHLHGSAVPRGSLTSLMSVMLFFIFKYVFTESPYVILHPYAVGLLASVTCFAVIFRSQSAIARYYEAAREAHHMQSKLADAASMAITFSMAAVARIEDNLVERMTKTQEMNKKEAVAERRRKHNAFCARITHNVSLFTATAYLLLRSDEDANYCYA